MKYIITDEQLDLIDNADEIEITRASDSWAKNLKENEIYVHFYGSRKLPYTQEEQSFILQGHEQVCVLEQHIGEPDVENVEEF